MKYVFGMPNSIFRNYEAGYADGAIADAAVLAEQLGFDAISCADHPFPSDAFMASGGFQDFDPFVTLSFFAQATTSIRLLTSVLVAGHRNPYMTAKSVMSLDCHSKGRFTLGIAAGYQQAEIEALGGSWGDRGRRLDESLEVIEMALSGESVSHDGPAFPAHGHTMLPLPRQRPRPPVWIGGTSDAAMRRAARFEGWMPDRFSADPHDRSFENLKRRVSQAQELRTAFKPGQPLEIWSTPRWRPDGKVIDYTPARIAEDVPSFEDAGVTWLRLGVDAASLGELLEAMHEFAELLKIEDRAPDPA